MPLAIGPGALAGGVPGHSVAMSAVPAPGDRVDVEQRSRAGGSRRDRCRACRRSSIRRAAPRRGWRIPGPRSSASSADPARPVGAERAQQQLAAAAVLHQIRRRLGDDDAPADRSPSSENPRPCAESRGRASRVTGAAGIADLEAARARSLPSRDGHPRPLARTRVDLELVDETARPAEPEPEPAAGRVAVAQRLLDVGDAGALILEDEPQAAPRAVVQRLEPAPCRRRRRARRCAPARWPRSRSSSGRPG